MVRKTFNLARLADISGIDKSTIQRWQIRGCMPVVAVGRGTDRSYTLSDALHVAVIAEMAAVGLTITGNGAMLSAGIVWHIQSHFQKNPSLDSLGSVALIPIPGEHDWFMEPRLEQATKAGSHVVIDIARIAEGVARRYSVDGFSRPSQYQKPR